MVALSSTEAEYIAAAECCKELLHVKALIEELTNRTVKVNVNIDNQSAIKLIKNGVTNKRSKHIDVKYHFVHELIRDKVINISYCPTNDQIADILTKPLERVKFQRFREKLVN